MTRKNLREYLNETRDALGSLASHINNKKEILEKLHRDNLFNRQFSAMLSSYSDFETVGLRLARTITESQKLEHDIQQRMQGLKQIPDELQPVMVEADRLTRENQADFKSLYIFAKIFLDEYTTLLGFIHNWRDIRNGSITSFYTTLSKYKGDDPQIKRFIDSCLNQLKAVDVFITQYRDDYIVHDHTEHKETRWFLNDMTGGIRFLGGRPSITPHELAFVAAGYVTNTSKFVLDNV